MVSILLVAKLIWIKTVIEYVKLLPFSIYYQHLQEDIALVQRDGC
jgi:hypothetical protein